MKKTTLMTLCFALALTATAAEALVAPGVTGGNPEQQVRSATVFVTGIISAIFGAVALICAMIIGFDWVRGKKEEAIERLWGVGGGVILFATVGSIIAGLYAVLS